MQLVVGVWFIMLLEVNALPARIFFLTAIFFTLMVEISEYFLMRNTSIILFLNISDYADTHNYVQYMIYKP